MKQIGRERSGAAAPPATQGPDEPVGEVAERPPTANAVDEASQHPGRRIRIAPSSIVLFAIVFWVVPLIGLFFTRFIDILLIIFLSILFSTFINPVVSFLERIHVHRGVGIILVYLFFAAALALIGRLAVPLFVDETQRLISALPADLRRLEGPLSRLGIQLPAISNGQGINIRNLVNGLLNGSGRQITGIAGQAVGLAFTVGTLGVYLISILVMTFFLTVQRNFTADVVNALVPPPYRRRTAYILSRMGERMGNWVIGQVIITIYYAVCFSAGLAILNVPYAVSVGVITGVLEIIPFVGGFIGLVLAVVVAATVNFTLVIWVIVLYLVVTNVEAHILVPNIYGRVVNLHPFLVIVALLFGSEAFGLLGALIAVPIAAALQVAVEQLYIRDVVEAAAVPARPLRRRPWLDLTALRRMRHPPR